MRRSGGAAESGQATAEWIGLMLALSLAFGGALGLARGADFGAGAHALRETLVGGLTCAVRDACRAEAAAMRELSGEARERAGDDRAVGDRVAHDRAVGDRVAHRRRLAQLRRWTSAPPEAFGGRGIRPTAPWEPAPRGLRGLDGASRRVLRALGRAGRSAGELGWLACLSYEQWRYDFEHPRAPNEGMPVEALLDELSDCLNPFDWVIP